MKIILVLITAILLCSCSKTDPSPVQMLVNSNMEAGTTTPNSWFLGHTATDIVTSWTTSNYSSGTHSLEISRDSVSDPTSYSAWGQNYQGNIPIGKDLTFSVKVKGSKLVGQGVSIVIRVDGSTTPDLQFVTTQGATSITGTFDWTTYNIKLINVTNDAKYIIVYMVYLQGTTGSVFFDDASLQHN